jgi:5'-3' exonuclease
VPLTVDPYTAEVLVYFDVHNLTFRAAEAPGPPAGFKNKQGFPTGYMFISVGKVYAALRHYGLKHGKRTCLMLSAQENSMHRKKMYPGYKAGRVHREYSSFEVTNYVGKIQERTPDPVQDFMEAMSLIPSVNVVMKTPHETDDAIASSVTQLKKVNHKATFVIVSNDRDLWALQGPRVICTSKPGAEFTLDDLEKAYLTRNPRLLPLAKALFGDSSDKIKKAVARVTEDNFPKHFLDRVVPVNGESLAESFELALKKNKKLISGTSLEKCLGKTKEIETVLDVIRLRKKLKLLYVTAKPDMKKMLALLDWYELKSLVKGTQEMFASYQSGLKP